MIFVFASLLATAAPDGRLLREDRACYTIYRQQGEQKIPMGVTFQSLAHGTSRGKPVWRIVVHQRAAGGRFDMRDVFVLDRLTLRPMSLVNTRMGAPHAAVTYGAGRITGELRDGSGAVSRPIDVPLVDPVWEGNLFGPTFAALPLSAGANFTLPTYQYDKGLGAFTVRVTGSEAVTTPMGVVEAWVLEVGTDPNKPLQYLISKADRRELGYRSPQGAQTLGGDCTGVD